LTHDATVVSGGAAPGIEGKGRNVVQPMTSANGYPGAPMIGASVRELERVRVDDTFKGVPLGRSLTLAEVGGQAWNVAAGDLALPALTLGRKEIENNLATMQAYCAANRVRLAPHGKTTMSPQLFARQFEHGAWGMTAATPSQVSVMRRYGVSRIILANEIADREALRWIANELAADETFEFFCLVDSAETVRRMDDVLGSVPSDVRISVLLEVGQAGARGGVRNLTEAVEVARALGDARHLRLAGVEAFEGVLASDATSQAFDALDELFALVRATVVTIADRGLFDTGEVIVTAGGSTYFDRVVASLSDWPDMALPITLILRSGCYISHDAGKYEQFSPLAQRRAPGERLRLVNALTLWGSVLSRPEPSLVLVGAGMRDAPVDLGLPRPRELFGRGKGPVDLRGRTSTVRIMDQHMFLNVPTDLDIRAGDIVSFDLSHPCTAFDKFKFVPLIDDGNTVVDAVLTFF
jgi:D-serine dehydratase